jgi:hypothetical protein
MNSPRTDKASIQTSARERSVRPPFLVHLLFHPNSTEARDLATGFHRALNHDARLPGLRIPTVLLREDGTGLPPLVHTLDEADRSVVVVFADSHMVVEAPVPPGRQSWPEFVANLAQQCKDGGHCFLPVQVSEDA